MPTLTIEGANQELAKVLIYLEGLQNGNTVSTEMPQNQDPKATTDKQHKSKSAGTKGGKKGTAESKQSEKQAEPKVKEEPKPEPVKPEPVQAEPVQAEVIPPTEDVEPEAGETVINLETLATAMKQVIAKGNKDDIAELKTLLKQYDGGLQNAPEADWPKLYDWTQKHLA